MFRGPRRGNALNPSSEATQRDKELPDPLPATRPRSLTLPLRNPSEITIEVKKKIPWKKTSYAIFQKTYDQSQSTLFNKLPVELRRLIYSEAIGRETLHIVHLHKRLGVVRCTYTGTDRWGMRSHDCWGHKVLRFQKRTHEPDLYTGPKEGFQHVDSGRLLALLKTCRRVYTEAIDILYNEVVFDVQHLDTVFSLSTTVLPHRFNKIRCLSLSWRIWYPFYAPPRLTCVRLDPPVDEDTWERFWALMASMQSLQWLKVELTTGESTMRLETKLKILEPLCVVRQTEVFDVKVPWPAQEMAQLMQRAYFTVEGSDGDVVTPCSG